MKRRPRMSWPWFAIWALPSVLVAGSIALFFLAAHVDHEIEEIGESPVEVVGGIVRIQDSRPRSLLRQVNYTPIAYFITPDGEGHRITLESTRDKERYSVGDEIVMRYASTNPELAYDVEYPPTSQTPFALAWLGLVVGALAAGGLGFATWRTFFRQKPRKSRR